MVDDNDWKAIMSSEIFREYVNGELRKEALAAEAKKTAAIDEELLKAESLDRHLVAMDKFEEHIKSRPELRAKFIEAKRVLIANPQIIDKVDPNFVSGIMMLDLGDE